LHIIKGLQAHLYYQSLWGMIASRTCTILRFPDITVTGNFCSQTFMDAEVGVLLYRWVLY